MGYAEIAPYFCFISNSVADLINVRWYTYNIKPPHMLDSTADSCPTDVDNSHTSLPYMASDASLAKLCFYLFSTS